MEREQECGGWNWPRGGCSGYRGFQAHELLLNQSLKAVVWWLNVSASTYFLGRRLSMAR